MLWPLFVASLLLSVRGHILDNSGGLVAEWSLEGVSDSEIERFFTEKQQISAPNGSFPSQRSGAGTWSDSRGNWYIFGGVGLTGKPFADLWRLDSASNAWKIISNPDIKSVEGQGTPYPSNTSFPLICTSNSTSLVSLFNPKGFPQSKTVRGFEENNAIWSFEPEKKAWTSIVCCDSCLGPTELKSCPHFNRKPLLWCSEGTINALEVRESNGSAIWWSFNLTRQKWAQNQAKFASKKAWKTSQYAQCRPLPGYGPNLYILCPSQSSQGQRSLDLLRFDQITHEISLLPNQIYLNRGFGSDLWAPEYSSLQGVSYGGATIILLAYDRLLDIWVVDESSGKVTPAENLWLGQSLLVFQHLPSFYSLEITFGNDFRVTMNNPRSKYASFDTGFAPRFKIRVSPDSGYALAFRNASFLMPNPEINKDSPERSHRFSEPLPFSPSEDIAKPQGPFESSKPGGNAKIPLKSPGNSFPLRSGVKYSRGTNRVILGSRLESEETPLKDQSDPHQGQGHGPSPGSERGPHIVNPGRERVHGLDKLDRDLLRSLEVVTSTPQGLQESSHAGVAVHPHNSWTTLLFYALSGGIFALMGGGLFFRSCVKCPPGGGSRELLKDPLPMSLRYDVDPEEVSFHPHTPIV